MPARMRDGVTLFADVYRPTEPGRYPALLMRTPYNKTDSVDAFVVSAVKRGYVVALQDVRGLFRSEGQFNPYLQEVTDGHDAIEWLAAQPYVNGKVGTVRPFLPGCVAMDDGAHAPSAPRRDGSGDDVCDVASLPVSGGHLRGADSQLVAPASGESAARTWPSLSRPSKRLSEA